MLLDVVVELVPCSVELLEIKLDASLLDSELVGLLLAPLWLQPVAIPITNELRNSVFNILFIRSPFLRLIYICLK